MSLFEGVHFMFLDGMALTFTSALTWIPLYAVLLYLVIKNNESMGQIFLIICCALACYFLSFQGANPMAVAMFFCLLVRNSLLNFFLFAWALIHGGFQMYSRGNESMDIAFGLLWGIVLGIAVYCLFKKIYYKFNPKLNYVSSQYTSTGYSHDDINIVITVMVAVCLYAVIGGMVRSTV